MKKNKYTIKIENITLKKIKKLIKKILINPVRDPIKISKIFVKIINSVIWSCASLWPYFVPLHSSNYLVLSIPPKKLSKHVKDTGYNRHPEAAKLLIIIKNIVAKQRYVAGNSEKILKPSVILKNLK